MPRALFSLALASIGCRYDFEARITDSNARLIDAFGTCDPSAPFGTPSAIAELNDPTVDDGTLRLDDDELSGYFWSQRLGDAEIFAAVRSDLASPFTVTHVAALGTASNELDPTVTADGTLIVFRRSGPGDHLYQAARTGPLTFGAATTIANVDQGNETQPYLQRGSNELYFDSNRTGGGDLYRSVRTGTSFAAPSRIAELATASDEGDPVVTPDGLTIYFRSDRPGSNPLYNIWTASRASIADAFGTATEVPNVSSAGNDGPSDISDDGCRLYISSDRAGTNDMYVATRSR